MKAKLYAIAILAGALVLSCKEKEPDVPGPGPEPISFTVSLPAEGPQSLYKWSEGDQVRINDRVFNLSGGKGSATGTFNGVPEKDSYYTICYPGDITGMERFRSYDLTGQTQKANDDTEHLIPTILIEDANSLDGLTLSKAWATDKDGTFHSNGVVAFNLTLPAGVSSLQNLTIESAGIAFPTDNAGNRTADKLELTLQGLNPENGQPLKAYLSVAEKEVVIPAETGIKISFNEANTSYALTLKQEIKMGGGILTDITVSDASAWKEKANLQGKGTEASPYLLKTAYDLEQMADALEEGKTIWFKMEDDIDMADVVRWMPLNFTPPYDMAIHFDGQGHKISHFKCEAGTYPSFFGVLNGTVKDVIFENAVINAENSKAGVVAGYLGTNLGTKEEPQYISANLENVQVFHSTVTGGDYAGGIAGQIGAPGSFTSLHVKDVTVSSTTERVGGIFGQVGYSNPLIDVTISDCSAENVTASAPKNVGALIGVCYGNVKDCTASGHVTATVESTKEVSVGGLIGHLECGNATGCWATTKVELTLSGRSIGGLVGTFKAGVIEKCYASGEIIGTYRNNGGFVGLIQANAGAPSSKPATIRNCYSTGNVNANSHTGGFVGLIDNPTDKDTGAEVTGTVTISNCYCTGNVIGTGFGIGGFVGYQGCPKFQADHCAAWGKTVTAGVTAVGNWSSGAFAAIAYPSCTLTDNYRNPEMAVTAWWIPDEGYQHPNVSPSNWLIVKDKESGELKTSPSKNLSGGNYPQLAYHGKVEAGKTLSQLASSTLGWDASVWYFGGELPTLK